jgi:hypothetical protein
LKAERLDVRAREYLESGEYRREKENLKAGNELRLYVQTSFEESQANVA